MRILIEVEVDEKEAKRLCSNSIERVINSSLNIADDSPHPDANTNGDDWRELKSLTVRLWTAAHSAIFAATNPKEIEDSEDLDAIAAYDHAQLTKVGLDLTKYAEWISSRTADQLRCIMDEADDHYGGES